MAPQVALVIKAIRDAQGVLTSHLAEEQLDAQATINLLIEILNDRKLVAVVRAMAVAGP